MSPRPPTPASAGVWSPLCPQLLPPAGPGAGSGLGSAAPSACTSFAPRVPPSFACRESRGRPVFHPAITSLTESCRGLSSFWGCPEQDQRELGTPRGLHPSPGHFHAESAWVGRSLRPLPCTPSPGTPKAPAGLAAWQEEGSAGSCLALQVGPRSQLWVPAGSPMPARSHRRAG